MSFNVTWYGHNTFACEIDGYNVLIDPFFDDNPVSPVKAADIDADFILVSHGHFDHVADVVSIAKRTGAKVITNVEIAGWLNNQGVENTHGQQHGGGFTHPFGYLKFTIAHHGSVLPDGAYGGNPVGFLFTPNDGGDKVYFACDTGLFYEMKFYGDEGIGTAFLPIGDNFTMGPADALKAVEFIRPSLAVPIHFDTWPPIAQDAEAWKQNVEAATDTQVRVMEPGETLQIS